MSRRPRDRTGLGVYNLLDHLNLFRLRVQRRLADRRQWDGYHAKYNSVRVHYLHRYGTSSAGGAVKVIDLAGRFPDHPNDPTILYLVSSMLDPNDDLAVANAKSHGIRIVLNQNGVAYPAWHGRGWRFSNRVLRRVLHQADYVIYQSEFSQMASDHFIGPSQVQSEVLHNPVDTSFFSPSDSPIDQRQMCLLVAGSHHQSYRIKSAVDTLAILKRSYPEARMLMAGRYLWRQSEEDARKEMLAYIKEKNLTHDVEILGPYTQEEAPTLMRRANILLHAKYNDNCPRVVVEAMACGLPVVYSASGGVPELVGDEGGVGVSAPLDWKRTFIPSSVDMADAVCRILDQYDRFKKSARQRAVTLFDVKPWLDRHKVIFESVLRGSYCLNKKK